MSEGAIQSSVGQVWADADAYEPYVGRWSRAAAREFVGWIGAPPEASWLDVGSGTGALTQTIVDAGSPRNVLGVDRSSGYVAYASARVTDARAHFECGDATALRFVDGSFDAAVSGLVLNFAPDPLAMLSEMRRVVCPRGVVALYVWDYAGEMQMMRRFWDAAAALDSTARALDEGVRFPICRPEPLAALFAASGLREVEVRAIDVPTVFRDFDDFWSPFLGGQGPAPSYAMALGETQRGALREYLRAHLPSASDGSIHLSARAWAVRGMP